jgi:hypothetical protein
MCITDCFCPRRRNLQSVIFAKHRVWNGTIVIRVVAFRRIWHALSKSRRVSLQGGNSMFT